MAYVATPIMKIVKLKKGISEDAASRIIGQHFPEVSDSLLNVLQLNQSSSQTELVLASIEQKSKTLQPIPFKRAINFKGNVKYIKYAAIPVSILLLTYATGRQDWFNSSYERVVNYQTAYEPPAPFEFFVLNETLETLENRPFKLQVSAVGEVVPENVQIRYNNQNYFLQPLGNGQFEFNFKGLKENLDFAIFANDVTSRTYSLKVLKVPVLEFMEMQLIFPKHTNKPGLIIKSGGNATVPEGTEVAWIVKARSTEAVNLYSKDTIQLDRNRDNTFEGKKRIFQNYNYDLATSNAEIKDYERLSYAIKVVKDSYPELNLKVETDSTDRETLYFFGQASDDYGLKQLNLVFYQTENPVKLERVSIPIAASNYSEFVSAFPDNLNLMEGVSYELYFEVIDNDAINGFKKTTSTVFNYRKLTTEEKEEQQLDQQKETINSISETFEKLKEQDVQLEEFSKTQKEKEALNFNDKKKLESFLKRQKQQEELMKNFNKNLKENLEEFQKEDIEKDPFKEALKERLKDNEKQLEEDEKLLKELEELQEKINKEELTEKLDKLAQQNKNKQRSMKQLLELTKRFYVSKKAEKVKDQLEKLAEEQLTQSEKPNAENTSDAQEKLNKKFDELRKEIQELKNENSKLQRPMPLPEDKQIEQKIAEDQKEAKENIEKAADEPDSDQKQKAQTKAKQKQKGAAAKMKKMSENLAQMMASGGAGSQSQMAEDAEMLRQILDNLVLFSFDEERLMDVFKGIGVDNNQYGKYIVKQNTLKSHFEHIDDSLFALSLRQPKLSEQVNKQISEVYFNIDKALDQLSENRLYQGIAAQQYTITAANELASFLSDMLDSMEAQMNPMPGSGGKGRDAIARHYKKPGGTKQGNAGWHGRERA